MFFSWQSSQIIRNLAGLSDLLVFSQLTSYLIVGYLQIFPFNGDSKTSPNLDGFTLENKEDAAI